jgi:AAA+ ATPase superfamily predicted ATPase
MLLKQELREGGLYHSAISAIAGGATRLNEISSKIGEERSKTIKYLDTLIGLGILYKEFPFGDDPAKSRKGIYRIKDNCYRFWYRYVFMNKAAVEQGFGPQLLKSFLPELNSFIGGPFEDVCMQYMMRKNAEDALPFLFTRSGRWWGGNPKTGTAEEIDCMFCDNERRRVIFAECKWRNDGQGAAVLKNLAEKAELFPDYKEKYFYVFSKAPFSKSCIALARQMGNVKLVGINKLF